MIGDSSTENLNWYPVAVGLVTIFGLFWTAMVVYAMASRNLGIDSNNISRHPNQKKNKKNIENGSSEAKSQLI